MQILAFADQSYIIDIGSEHKPARISIGWRRWYPSFINFPRWRRLPPA